MNFFYSLITIKVNARRCCMLALMMCGVLTASAQPSFAPYEHLFTPPKSYVARYVNEAIIVDGKFEEKFWNTTTWTDAFVDIEGDKKAVPRYTTKVKMAYNDSFLLVAAQLDDPHVWATLKRRDTIIYHDNDFEVFISSSNNGHQYYEVEVNAFNTILDLLMPKPYRNGAGAMIGYDLCGLQSAVQVQGTLNNATDKDSGWRVEMAIPFRHLIAGNTWKAPEEGQTWRINFSRVHWDTEIVGGRYIRKKDSKGKLLPEYNWVWSPQGVVNMHYPERWGYLQFTRRENGTVAFVQPYNELRRPYLWLVYYKQKDYHQKHGRYAGKLSDLGMPDADILIGGQKNKLAMEATSRQFTAYIIDQNSTIALNNEGLVQTISKPLL